MDTTVNSALSIFAFSQAQPSDQLVAAAQVSPLGEADAEEGKWIMILPAGRFTARDGRGPFVTGDVKALQEIIDASLLAAGSTDIMVDYDHQSFFGVRPGVGGTAKAAGWFTEFEARKDGIWGKVTWTQAAAEAIRNREYRYFSPLFNADKTGRVRFLKNGGLVNQPALDIPAVAANLQTEGSEDMKSIAKLLGLPEDATEDQIAAAIKKLQDGRNTVAASLKLGDDAEFETIATAVQGVAGTLGKIAVAAGLKEDAKSDEIVAAVSASAGAGEDVDASKFVPMSMFNDVKSKLEQLENGVSEKAVTEAVEGAIKSGKLPPANKDWAMSYAKQDPAGFEKFLGNAPSLTAAQLSQTKRDPSKPTLSESDKLVAASMGLSAEDFIAARNEEAS